MKLLDKLKNALFEEEYVEVEEKQEVKKKEKPIAKKIIIDDKPKKAPVKEDLIVEEEKKESPNRDFKFKAILDDDFINLEQEKKEEKTPKVEAKMEEKNREPKRETKEKRPLYQGEKKKEEKNIYGSNLDKEIKIHEYGGYEKQKEKKEFHPSPIISPIYGVLDQNYKKDDIVTKKEIRITSSYKSKNIDVDSVREKAYGNTDDIFEEELTSNKKHDEEPIETYELNDFEITEEESLLDISAENTPSVARVTMGDAEEYYSDLGLEYNIDYKDASHEKATGRRTDLKDFKEDDYQKEDTSIEDNLFDLIDSMYDEKKGE
mgnify:FL=1